MEDERRKHDRFDVNLSAQIEDVETGERTEIRFQNLSKSGGYFLAGIAMLPGDQVMMQLGDGLIVAGRVVSMEQLFEDRFGISIRFTQNETSKLAEEIESEGLLRDFYQLELRELNGEAFRYYPRLKRVLDYVEAHLTEPITLEDAAAVAAMEKTYFSSYFHQKVGVTFSVWLQYGRIKRALELLRARNRSVTEIAFAVGFNELSTFQKAFKRWTNLTPSDFKKITRPS